MSERQRPAAKPERLRTNVLNKSVSPISPALHGATSAFLPKQSPATTTLSPLSASPSSAGARFAARAAGTRSHVQSSTPLPPTPIKRDEVSPERGRSINLPNIQGGSGGFHGEFSPIHLSPTRSIRAEQSPSTIAAIHASSKSSSPMRSPNRSPHRRANTMSDSRTTQILPSDLSRALAGAVKSMATAQKDMENPFVPVRDRMSNFEKLSPTGNLPAQSGLSAVLGGNQETKPKPRLSTLIPQTSLEVPLPTRDRAHSVGEEQPLRKVLSREVSASRDQASEPPLTESTPAHRIERSHRPPIPTRQSHNAQRANIKLQTSGTRNHRGMTVNGLADAMVASSLASSLASSRAASPAKRRPLPPASRRRSRSFSALYDLSAKYDVSATRKPPKLPRPMKQTLRKPSETEDDEVELVKRGRRHWMRKHPNKHQEGDRKRWRDKVTERERKRYEGIFAANRGLFIGTGYFKPSATALADNSFESNKVVNVIVRDIWERSRLPSDILMEIYDLVAPEEDKSLGREQFVVGMWLIDQRLKGRKLPVKVSSSVWSSVRHPDGIKLRGRGP